MSAFKIPSRNKHTVHKEYTTCPNCRGLLYYDLLEQSGHIEHLTENTKIITCPFCKNENGEEYEFVPDVTIHKEYRYSNRCKTRDKRQKNTN